MRRGMLGLIVPCVAAATSAASDWTNAAHGGNMESHPGAVSSWFATVGVLTRTYEYASTPAPPAWHFHGEWEVGPVSASTLHLRALGISDGTNGTGDFTFGDSMTVDLTDACSVSIGGSISATGGGTTRFSIRAASASASIVGLPLTADGRYLVSATQSGSLVESSGHFTAGSYAVVVEGEVQGGGAYDLDISVTVPTPCSLADIATEGNPFGGADGFVTGVDFDLFVLAYFQAMRRPTGTGPLVADIADGLGNPGPDGFLTGTDFDLFVMLYFKGC